ncbi:MAG: permease-like cell division protein FtsX [bacterium]|nr:permease-like cell division protein FtsX [bacterium]
MRSFNIRYFIKEGIKNIFRNKAVSFNSILTISLALLVFSIFLLISSNIRLVIENWENSADITIYLKDNIPENKIAEMKDKLSEEEFIKTVKFISKEEALKNFSEDEDIKQLIEILEENPLPNILEVYFIKDRKTSENITLLREKLRGFQEIEDVQSRSEIAKILYTSKMLGLILSVVFLFLAMLISSNTIKLTVLSKQTEIEIMKLVGATSLFIKLPFITEGIIKGVMSALVSIFFLYLFYFILNISFDFSYLITVNFISFRQIVLIIFTGGLIGCIGALLTLRKFLKF